MKFEDSGLPPGTRMAAAFYFARKELREMEWPYLAVDDEIPEQAKVFQRNSMTYLDHSLTWRLDPAPCLTEAVWAARMLCESCPALNHDVAVVPLLHVPHMMDLPDEEGVKTVFGNLTADILHELNKNQKPHCAPVEIVTGWRPETQMVFIAETLAFCEKVLEGFSSGKIRGKGVDERLLKAALVQHLEALFEACDHVIEAFPELQAVYPQTRAAGETFITDIKSGQKTARGRYGLFQVHYKAPRP